MLLLGFGCLSFYKLDALGARKGFLELCSLIVAKLLFSCLCLFDTVVALHAMDEHDFFIGE